MTHPPHGDDAPPATADVGVEIADGGMRIVVALALDGMISGTRWRRRLAAPPSPDEALTAVCELIGQALREGAAHAARPNALGVAVWGDVDPLRGVTLGMPHAEGWEDFPLAERLADRWQVPVRLQSAVAAAGLAEATARAGQRHRVALYIHSGRTIASALLVEGGIVPGASGRAGKLAHWLVQPDGPRCSCGQRGHLDPIASAQAIVRSTIGLASGSDESTAAMLRVSGRRAEAMTVRQVVQLASEGDPAARTVLERAWNALALALANLVTVLDPDIIIFGGPPAEVGDAFIVPLQERLAALSSPWRPTPEVIPGALEPSAALVGACLLPYNHWHDRS
jgi:glucokinase